MGSVRIKKAFPPNIKQIRAAFILSGTEIFAWDGIIYNPSGNVVPPELVEHEKVHFKQQRAAFGPEKWWELYLADPEYRLAMELEAHIVEYRYYADRNNRNARRHYLLGIAKRLASPMYGNMLTRQKARVFIKQGARA